MLYYTIYKVVRACSGRRLMARRWSPKPAIKVRVLATLLKKCTYVHILVVCYNEYISCWKGTQEVEEALLLRV